MSSYESHVTTSPVFDKPAKIVYPFADVGDVATKEVHQSLYQLADRYVPPTLGSVFVPATHANFSASPISIGDAYCIGDSDLNETESGLVSFTRKWANVPATTITAGGTVMSTIAYLTINDKQFFHAVSSLVKKEYYRVGAGLTYTDASKIPALTPNSYITVSPEGVITEFQITGPGSAQDFNYLLQPSSLSLYAGTIYCRESIYIKGP
jgi:hypothetical protein